MADNDNNVKALQQHFSRRVIGDARSVVDQWFQLQHQHWCTEWYDRFYSRLERLRKSAGRYQRDDLAAVAETLKAMLADCRAEQPPQSDALSAISDAVAELGKLASRQSDHGTPDQAAFARQEVYIAISDTVEAAELAGQLASFGIQTTITEDPAALEAARAYRRPLAILIEVDFHGENRGFELIESIQQEVADPVPVVFHYPQKPSMEQRLRAMRVGGKGFIDNDSGLLRVVERLERESHSAMPELYRVLIVDDSRTQAMHASQTLNGVGMITQTLSAPLQLLETIDDFQPDIILMDMYMPKCNGVELATVMRQQPKYDRLPIIFLSAEEDMAKQMHAMSEGGDDFLTKPVNADILTATVQHRCKRNRAVRNWMERDSLTGLFDHTHLLQHLQQEIIKAERQGTPLSFVMLDLDKFKAVNDTWGHAVGDRVLQNLSLLLRQRLRKTDIIGRYGGEEFGLIMPDTSADAAYSVMNELLDSFSSVRHPVTTGEERDSITCTFSGGVANWLSEESVSSLSMRADGALYKAKTQGRSRLLIAAE